MVDIAAPAYPADDQFGEPLLRALGSFWYYYFSDRDKLQTMFRAQGHIIGQTYIDYLEAVAAVSRFDVPIFHEENWYLLVLKRSDRDNVFNGYGQDDLNYDGSIDYGAAQTRELLFPLPQSQFFGDLVNIPYNIYNAVLYPSRSWTRGVDFDIDHDRGLIRFRDDPFESDQVARRGVYDVNGRLVDEEIGLWVFKGQWDLDYIYNHWGFAVGIQLESSQGYRDLINAVWDNYVLGPTIGGMTKAISALLGVPLVQEAEETVELVVTETGRKLVITDKHVYEYQRSATVAVSAGDVVKASDSLISDVKIVDLAGYSPDTSGFSGVVLDDNFLSGGYFGELVFENRNVSVDYQGKDNDGKAVVTFALQGFPADVDLFFEQAQQNAKATGMKTLAELLDLRGHPSNQPMPINLPSQINPFEFVLLEIMKNHVWLIKVNTAAIRDDSPGLSLFRYFRDVVPPQTTYLVFVEIEPEPDTIDSSEDVEEAIETFDGIIVDSEELSEPDGSDDASYEDVVLAVYPVSEQCK